jgi:hypothetical protein
MTEQTVPPGGAVSPSVGNSGDSSLTRLVAPIFASFSLPSIVTLIAAHSPSLPWREAALSLLIASTGLFMASVQLTIGRLQKRFDSQKAQDFRGGLSVAGIVLVAAALACLVWPTVRSTWLILPLAVLFAGGVVPAVVMIILGPEEQPSAKSGAEAGAAGSGTSG